MSSSMPSNLECQQWNGDQKQAPKLPEAGKRNILITSALPYVNNVPHLGNIIGCVLSADTYARYCRARGYNAIYICGTDEYGTATETKAREEKLTPKQLCDKYHTIHKDVYKWFDISFDYFGRTSVPKQTEIAQDIFHKIYNRGFCEEKTVQQLFCEKCNSFLADRFVEGTCPHCGFTDARGDQCDQCGKLLDPLELKEPRCKFDRTTPTVKSSNHIFLNLPKAQDQLEAWVNQSSTEGDWTANSVHVTKSWIATGLKSRCITRDLRWGTPVPLDGYRDKVFYVWFDAPIGYISITANYTDQWEKWWKNPDQVRLIQFMGKDNVPFHTVIFPSTLISTGENWTLLHHLSTTEYLNYESGKFSKSRGTGVFGDTAQSTGIPADIWRYYLLTNRPESSDFTFSWDDFMNKNNSDLLDNFGNMCNRVLSFIKAKFASQIPDLKLPLTQTDLDFICLVDGEFRKYLQMLEKVSIREGVRIAMNISRAANKYVQEMGPWVLFKSDRERCGTVLHIVADVILLLAHLFSPYMPGLARQVLRQLNLPDDDQLISIREPPVVSLTADQFKYPFPDYTGHQLAPGHTIGAVAPLIRKLLDSEIKELKQRFIGNSD